MGCGCSTAARAAGGAVSGPASMTVLVIGLDNSGKTTLSRTINGGEYGTTHAAQAHVRAGAGCR